MSRGKLIVSNVFEAALVALAGLMLVLGAVSWLSRGSPTDPRTWALGIKPMVVLGGSMEPAIHVGSIIVVARTPPSDIHEQDIISYVDPRASAEHDPSGSQSVVTHRVLCIEQDEDGLAFRTKGDANEDEDASPVRETDLLGRVVADVPLLGYLSRFASTWQGLVALVVLPGLLVAGSELRSMWRRDDGARSDEA